MAKGAARSMAKLIVIDPGHDHDETGSTQIDGGRESEFNLALARATRDALLAGYDCRVVLTHDGPGMVPGGDLAAELRARGELPNKLGADLFFSIHHNAGPKAARGAELYIWTGRRAGDGGLVWLPAVDPATGAANHQAPRSFDVACVMQPIIRESLERLGIPWRVAPNRIMCADFAVLRYPSLPCMLLETHYGTNQQDDDIADSPAFIAALAGAIARAIAAGLQLAPNVTASGFPTVRIHLLDGTVVAGELRGQTTWIQIDGTWLPIRPVVKALGLDLVWHGADQPGGPWIDLVLPHPPDRQ